MRAAVFHGAGTSLTIETMPDPTPAPDQVVVKICRCGICSSELNLTEAGAVPADMPADIKQLVSWPPGLILGHEYSGEVVARGSAVGGLRVGDHVTVLPAAGCGACLACLQGEPIMCAQVRPQMGGYGEYVTATEGTTVKLPVNVSLADGALVEPLASSLNAVSSAGLAPGARILVLGAGPIGLGVAFWARRFGAGKVAVAARSNRREELAGIMGATDFLIDTGHLAEDVKRALGGPPDIVFECVGIPGMLQTAMLLVRARGKVVACGQCLHQDTLYPAIGFLRGLTIQFSVAYALHHFQHAVEVLDTGTVAPRAMVTDTISLEALPAVFDALRKPNPHCKVMVDPWAAA